MHNFVDNYDDIVFPPDPLTRLARAEQRIIALEAQLSRLEAALNSIQRVSDRVQLDDVTGKWHTVTENGKQ